MRDLISCFNENTIKVSDSSCSSSHSHSTKNTVSCLYKTNLSSQKQFLIIVTWCKNNMGRGLSIHIHDSPFIPHNLHASSCRFWSSKGTRSFQFNNSKINIYWDISSAQYKASLEPFSHFYVIAIIDSQIGLLLGDMDEEEALKKFKIATPIAHSFLVARKQYLFGTNVYSTKACFGDGETYHDILIKCRGDIKGQRDPELSVSIDRKKAVHVKRLHWKFRGNQTILVDGSPVEILWDVHGWLFNPHSGMGIFVFRRKSELACWPCVEERSVKEEERVGFSMLIYACKSS